MTVTVRKGVLLRLDPDLLERVDAERGLQSRTSWLTDAVERYLDTLSPSDAKIVGVDWDGTPPVHAVDLEAFPQGKTQSGQANERAPVAAVSTDGLGAGTPSEHLSNLTRSEQGSPCLLDGASGDAAGHHAGQTPMAVPEGVSVSEAPSDTFHGPKPEHEKE